MWYNASQLSQTAELRGTGMQYVGLLSNLRRESSNIQYCHLLYQLLLSVCSMEHMAWHVIENVLGLYCHAASVTTSKQASPMPSEAAWAEKA